MAACGVYSCRPTSARVVCWRGLFSSGPAHLRCPRALSHRGARAGNGVVRNFRQFSSRFGAIAGD
eukprot:1191395-Prorocentrum_minimum.AAC.6